MYKSLKLNEFLSKITPGERKLLNQAADLCQKQKGRLTHLRQVVFIIISRAIKGAKAYEILHIIKELIPKAAPPTVYRALNFLMTMNLINKVNTCQTYKVSMPDLDSCGVEAMLVCPRCNKQTRLNDDGLIYQMQKIIADNDFAPLPQLIEIVSLCNQCR
ncbi:TPA: transcriptional repressor [Klebsiella variicola]|uniref:transcriptional repressor n=1 Tax=Klebsiella variicola TaxID=244366 RepID=UPI0007CCA3F1|nr:transcriptional repressor [Klebsiella variicola]PXJ81709.1 hypothetical protein DMR30_23300 [Klebsiella variicola]SBK83165.1 zinc uptake transcriptional repressor [Klebsiella variicola]HCL6959829.1 transcriptional repressor [Klebsiella variicola]